MCYAANRQFTGTIMIVKAFFQKHLTMIVIMKIFMCKSKPDVLIQIQFDMRNLFHTSYKKS